MRRIVKIVVVVAIVALIVNDGGRLGRGVVHLRTSTTDVLNATTESAAGAGQQRVVDELSAQASARQISVTRYSITAGNIHIWTQEEVSGTWIVGPVIALQHGTAFSQAWSVPIVIHYDASAGRT
jgi:hypothetical protein